jgi:hypothetical protein
VAPKNLRARPLDALHNEGVEQGYQSAAGRQPARPPNDKHRRIHDRSLKKSVIFDPNICHVLNEFNTLSHARAIPPILEEIGDWMTQ